MVPCAGFGEVCEYARRTPKADLGIHLTLTSEWDRQRWAPVLDKEKVRSLSDADGHFWRSRAELFSFCRPQEAEAELRGQIECALAAGVDVTHLDSHMFILHSRQKNLARSLSSAGGRLLTSVTDCAANSYALVRFPRCDRRSRSPRDIASRQLRCFEPCAALKCGRLLG